MEMRNLKSGMVDTVFWNNNTLIVRFNTNQVYAYEGVPQHVYTNMIAAQSKGRFFLQEIKNRYAFTRLTR